jgi:drug/metabolite transporter (DMT)-like permease
VFTGMEKFVELIGQTLRIFVLNGTWRAELLSTADSAVRNQLLANQESFNALWGSMYFVLWLCGSLAALAFAIAFWRSQQMSERWLAWIAALVAMLGLLMILAEYFGQTRANVAHPAVYFVAMTSYRAAIAWVLWTQVGLARAHVSQR